ncbi:MAG: hypothetical protein KC549_00770, partial [Myxococcales bacterium]|nr:hypothetical protein [Myxococcales bacterium]
PEPTPGGPWPESFESAPGRWQSRHAPPPAEVDALLAELRRFLGPDGYRWLQGLAAHPELRWPLTLFIGLRLQADGEPLLSERRLIDLTRLPWLRAGWLPDWLRLRLLAGISPEDDQAVRAFLQDLLAQQSDRHQAFRLDVARRDPQRSGSRPRWRQLIADILRAEPADSPLHDRLFVDFLQGRKLGALQLSAPGGLRRLVWSQGLRGLGLRPLPVVAFSAALLVACVVLSVGLHRLEARFLQPATFFTSPLADPGDHQLSRRDGLGIVAAGFCTDGSDGIAIADPAPDLDCGAALLPDEPTDAVLGGLSTSPLLQAATVTRLRPDQGLMVVATGRFAHLVRTDGPGTMVLSVEHPEPIVAVDLAPDGGRLLTASSLKVLVWGVDARTQDPRSARDSFTLEPESERPGDDLRDFDAGSADDCRSACAAEARCEAFTFASRGSWSGVDPHCWLKRVASDKVLKRGHYSGMRVRPVEIENQTAVVMTGEVAYSHCPIQSFTIAPGALWTGAPRKDCAITGITAAPPRVPGRVPSGAVPFQGRTQAPGFRIVSWGQRQRVVAVDSDVGSATFSPATYANGCVGRLDVQAAPGWRVQEIRGDGDVQVNGGVTFPPGPARIARVGVAFQGSGGLQNENIELALPACKLIPRAVPNAAGDRAYLYDTTLRTYDEQRRLAADMGGHLATLTTPEELAFVTPLAVAIGPWIGLWSPRKDGVFETITGEPAGPPPFCAGEPNNAGRDEYAGELWDQGCLNDEGPTKPRGLLVEFERPGVPEDLSQGGTFVRPGAPAGQSDRTFIRVTRPTNVALDVHDEGGSCKAGTRLLIVRRAGDVVMPDTGVSPCPSIGMPLDPGLYDVNVAGLGGPLEPYQIKATFYISRDPARRPPSATLLQAF